MKIDLNYLYAKLNGITYDFEKLNEVSTKDKIKNCLGFYEGKIDLKSLEEEEYKNNLIFLISFVLNFINDENICDSYILESIGSIIYKLYYIKLFNEVDIKEEYSDIESNGC